MRDIRPQRDFVVHGDFTVNEAPQEQYVPFEQMGLEDLRANLQHHSQLAKDERRRINAVSFKLMWVSVAVTIVISIWYFIAGKVDLAMFLISLAGIGMPVVLGIKNCESKSEFELRQLNTIRHLSHLIRERTPR